MGVWKYTGTWSHGQSFPHVRQRKLFVLDIFYANLTQAKVILEEETSIEKMTP